MLAAELVVEEGAGGVLVAGEVLVELVPVPLATENEPWPLPLQLSTARTW